MTAAAGRKVTEVAVGVLVRADGAVLLADRPTGKPYPGYWEFPGGKVEPGESTAAALARELHEELGIHIAGSVPWVTFEFDYPHAYVRLHFERVYSWQGVPHAREGQQLGFFVPSATLPEPLLPAAVPALRWLLLPDVLTLEAESRSSIGPLITNESLRTAGTRPTGAWVGAFIESREDLVLAARRGCDFALAGPIRADPRLSPRPEIGWSGFADLARTAPLPVFAYGRTEAQELEQARAHGAHGVARSVPAP
jgi:8-oxo-dGTP diphosphatase